MGQKGYLGHASTVAWLVMFLAGSASSQTSRPPGFTILQGYDLPQGDYRSGIQDPLLRNISFSECQQHCAADDRCKAFTYNATRRVCILKNAVPTRKRFVGAVSGIKLVAGPVDTTSSPRESADTSAPDYKGTQTSLRHHHC